MKRSCLFLFVFLMMTVCGWCEGNFSLMVPRSQERIKLDGNGDDPVWAKARESAGAKVSQWQILNDGSPAEGRREALFIYDDEFLYVLYEADVEDMETLLSLPSTPEEGDCVRLEIADTSMGVDCEGLRLQILLPYLIPLESAIARKESGWSIEMAIPWAHIGGKPTGGKKVPFNISANDTTVGQITWAPVKDPRDTRNFGTLQIDETP